MTARVVWVPPDPLALTEAECAEILAAADLPATVGALAKIDRHGVLTPAVMRVCQLAVDVNAASWRFPFEYLGASVKAYGAGVAMAEHSDYDPAFGEDQPCSTFAASVQLSAHGDYTGGALHLADGTEIPRDRGTVVVWPATTRHGVRRVLSGCRVALVVFAVFGTNSEAHAAGWPGKWVAA